MMISICCVVGCPDGVQGHEGALHDGHECGVHGGGQIQAGGLS